MNKWLFLVPAFLLGLSNAWCSQGNDALTAFTLENYSRAFQVAKSTPEGGNYISQFVLGRMYEDGKGANQDKTEAEAWFTKALSQAMPLATAGDAQAQFVVAQLQEGGRGGLEQDGRKAVDWYRKAAEQGNADAENALGLWYAYGLQDYGEQLINGDRINLNKEIAWYRKAAEQGHPGAEYNLAELYSSHGALPNSNEEAVSWYTKAAEQGHITAQRRLAGWYALGAGGLSQDYTAAISWYRKAADEGDTQSQVELGNIYEEGKGGTPKDHKTAISWYCKAGDIHCKWDADEKAKLQGAQKQEADLRPKQLRVEKLKHTTKFTSYAAAGNFFDGTIRNREDGANNFGGRVKYLGPLGTKSNVVVAQVKILQVLDKNNVLLSAPALLETYDLHMEGKMDYVAYGRINPNFTGPRNFAEGRCYIYIGEETGTKEYTTARGFAKTVPSIFIYAIGTLNEGLKGTEGVDYQCR